MKFGEQLSGIITSMDAKGRGVFRYLLPKNINDSRSVAVPFTAIGDKVEATFHRRDQGAWLAWLDRIMTPSPDRIPTPCPHAGTCGGCLWQHISYPSQLELKRQRINQALADAGRAERISFVQPSPTVFGYRNRMDYAVGWHGEIGLKEFASWNRYVDLQKCCLMDTAVTDILRTVRELMHDLSIEPWDATRGTGLLRYVTIRRGVNTGERMIILVVKDMITLTYENKTEITQRLSPYCSSLLLGENPEITDLSFCKTFDVLRGMPFLTERVNNLEYRIHPNSFFQTNTTMAAQLQNTVLDLLGDITDKRILDLYCGLGFFSIACAAKGAWVVGHELDKPAVDLAKINAQLNRLADRARFSSGSVEDLLWKSEHPDAVIVDPPRSGLHPRALRDLVRNHPPILIYVSCNYSNMIRELAEITSVYRIEDMVALDMFPHTPHVEVITKFVRK